MENQLNFGTLKKQNFLLKITIFCLILFTLVSAFTNRKAGINNFDEITVKKLSLVDSTGKKRMIMTTDFAKAPWGGQEVKRNVPPGMAGMIYLDTNGDEVGGLAFGGSDKGKVALSTLDYTGMPLEAIGYSRVQTEKYTSAGFVVMDNPRIDSTWNAEKFLEENKSGQKDGAQIKLLQKQMVSRVELGVVNHDARLILKDNKGKDRIILGVNDNNEAVIKILDEDGNVIQKFPE
jgi:hypothetical protein